MSVLTPSRENRHGVPGAWRVAVLALTGVAAAIRFVRLDFQSLWLDEYLWTRTASLKTIAAIIDRRDGYPPTVALLFRALGRWGLDTDLWLRLPSALAGTLAVPLMYLVARRLVGARSAVAAAALLAVHPLAVWYSQEAGAYAGAMLAALAATYCLLRLFSGAGLAASAGYALAAGVGFGLHYYFAYILIAHAPFAFVDAVRRPERRRIWVATAIMVAVSVGPWIPLFLGDVGGQAEQERGHSNFSLLALPYTAQAFVGGLALGPSVRSLHPAVRSGDTPQDLPTGAMLLPAMAILVAVGLFLLALPGHFAGHRGLLLALCFVPVFGPWLNSLLSVGYRPRYALIALPFAIILFVGSLASRRRWLAGALLLAYVALGLTGLVASYAPEHRREDNRAAAALVAAGGGGDVVLVGEGADPFQRYAVGVDRLLTLDAAEVRDQARLEERLAALARGRSSLWLVSSRPWTEDPEGRVGAFFTSHLALQDVHELAGVTVRRFARPQR